MTDAVGAIAYFDVETRNGQTDARAYPAFRCGAAKLADLELSEQDIADAVTWARQGGDS